MLLGANLTHAQRSASHSVSVRIPHVLQLSINGQTAGNSVTKGVTATRHQGGYTLDPARHTVRVLANSAWQLSASVRPNHGASMHPTLTWQLGNTTARPFAGTEQVIKDGTETQTFDVTYGLDYDPTSHQPLDKIEYKVTYSLTRP